VLWPYLLEAIVPAKYTNAVAIVAKCLGHIAALKREENTSDYIIDFDKAGNNSITKHYSLL
jgi:hypothetical protein